MCVFSPVLANVGFKGAIELNMKKKFVVFDLFVFLLRGEGVYFHSCTNVSEMSPFPPVLANVGFKGATEFKYGKKSL